MKRTLQTAAAALAIALAGVSASAQEASQLAASAGLTAAEARSMTLSEIFAAKANRGAGFDDRQVIVASQDRGVANPQARRQLAASAGLSADAASGLTLGEIFAAKANRGASFDERQVVVSSRSATMAGDPATRQLIAQTSLSFGEAASLSLNEIAAIKFNRGSRTDQRQTAPY